MTEARKPLRRTVEAPEGIATAPQARAAQASRPAWHGPIVVLNGTGGIVVSLLCLLLAIVIAAVLPWPRGWALMSAVVGVYLLVLVCSQHNAAMCPHCPAPNGSASR